MGNTFKLSEYFNLEAVLIRLTQLVKHNRYGRTGPFGPGVVVGVGHGLGEMLDRMGKMSFFEVS